MNITLRRLFTRIGILNLKKNCYMSTVILKKILKIYIYLLKIIGLHQVCEPSVPKMLPEPEDEYHLPDEPNWVHRYPPCYQRCGTHALIDKYFKVQCSNKKLYESTLL